MRIAARYCFLGFIAAGAGQCSAQQLSVSVDAAGQGKTIALSLHNGPSSVSTLRWDLIVPVEQIQINAKGPTEGPVATAAGKSVACYGTWLKAPRNYLYSCVLSGSGARPIGDGVIAVLEVQPASERPILLKIQLHAEGLTPDYKQVEFKKVNEALALQ